MSVPYAEYRTSDSDKHKHVFSAGLGPAFLAQAWLCEEPRPQAVPFTSPFTAAGLYIDPGALEHAGFVGAGEGDEILLARMGLDKAWKKVRRICAQRACYEPSDYVVDNLTDDLDECFLKVTLKVPGDARQRIALEQALDEDIAEKLGLELARRFLIMAEPL